MIIQALEWGSRFVRVDSLSTQTLMPPVSGASKKGAAHRAPHFEQPCFYDVFTLLFMIHIQSIHMFLPIIFLLMHVAN